MFRIDIVTCQPAEQVDVGYASDDQAYCEAFCGVYWHRTMRVVAVLQLRVI